MALRSVGSGKTGCQVELLGYKSLETAMKSMAPDLLDQMNATIKAELMPVQLLAQSFVPSAPPMSGWKASPEAEKAVHPGPRRKARGGKGWPGYDAGVIRKGIRVGKGGSSARRAYVGQVAWRLDNKSAAGAIYEIAGRKSNGKGQAGRQFIQNLNRHGHASRLIWRAWDARKGTVMLRIEATVDSFEAEFQKRVDGMDKAA